MAFYSQDRYVSKDLDFVNVRFVKRSKIRDVMREIGFEETDRYFRHSESSYLIEFPPGPLTVGEQPISEIHEIKLSTGTLRLLTSTDCVKDRLAAFFYWGDRQCLHQAVWVNQTVPVDLIEVERWSVEEGNAEQFITFSNLLSE